MTNTVAKSPTTLSLTEDERTQLLSFLEQALKDARVEEHRTDAFEFKAYVRQKEAFFQGVIDKLRRSV
ncbi:MAG: hypothetical protein U0746_08420 [Gemmataceae bacterium]